MREPDEFAEVDTTQTEFEAMWQEAVPFGGARTRRTGVFWTLDALSGTTVSGSRIAGRAFAMTSRTLQPSAEARR